MSNDLSIDDKSAYSLYTLFIYGVGQTLGSIVTGKLQDKFGHKTVQIYLLCNFLVFKTFLLTINEL